MSARRAFKPSSDGILEAAETAFAKHGYNELSLRQLISASRVSTTAFYARFDSKEAVLAALTSRLFGELHADVTALLSAWDTRDAALRTLVEQLRAEADGVEAMGYSQQADRLRDCAGRIDAILKETT